MKVWIPVIAALLGVLVGIAGNYATGAAQPRRQQEAERKKFLLGKLEETHTTAIAVRDGIQYSWVKEMYHFTFSEEMPEDLKNQLTKHVPLERLHTLVDFYFKELKPYYDEVENGRDRFGTYLADSTSKRNASQAERSRLRNELTNTRKEFDRSCSEFLEAASKLVERFL